jgi:putative transposase
MMVDYIDRHRTEFGVEPICNVLQVAPSTYYSAKFRPASARQVRDDVVMVTMLAIWQANYSVYGARKLWKAMRRAGVDIGRDQVARLMRTRQIRGIRRGRQVVTTRPAPGDPRAPDLVRRDFTAAAPNECG